MSGTSVGLEQLGERLSHDNEVLLANRGQAGDELVQVRQSRHASRTTGPGALRLSAASSRCLSLS